MLRPAAALFLAFISTSAICQTSFQETPEFHRGWCAAVGAVIRNRDHYRAMVHYPAETVEQSMKRIYESWPPKPPAGFLADTIVSQGLNLEMAGIDLYVILPPQTCEEK